VTALNHSGTASRVELSLEVRDLSYSYGALSALSGVSFRVEPGQICCVLGPNGAGKSTLGAIIGGALTTPPGTVWLGTDDVSGESVHRRARRGMAYVPEGGAIFPALTVTENLCLGTKKLTRRKKAKITQQAASIFPFLGNRRNTTAGMLSGGEQQMLSLARIFIAQPSVVMIDELSHGLAPAIVEQLFGTLTRLRGDTTFILNEQYLGRAHQIADLILVLSRGETVYWGSARDTSLERLEALYKLGTVQGTVFPARQAGLRSGGMGTVSDDIGCCESTQEGQQE
jgi:branched-chain amino acid transport system ATP-binding protein